MISRVRRFSVLLVFLVLFVSQSAFAQGVVALKPESPFSLNRFNPATRTSDGFGLLRPVDLGPLGYSAQAVFNYALHPLLLGDPSGKILSKIVDHELTAHIGAAVAMPRLWSRLSLELNLPLVLFMHGANQADRDLYRFHKTDPVGLGDLEFGARVRIWGENDDPFSIGAYVGALLPTAYWINREQHWSGYKGIKGRLNLHAEVRPLKELGIILNLGGLFGSKDPFGTLKPGVDSESYRLHLGQQLSWGLGLFYQILDNKSLTVHAEVLGDFLVLGKSDKHLGKSKNLFGRMESTHIEALAGVKYWTPFGLAVGLGVGSNLFASKTAGAHGLGTPRLRILFNIGYEVQNLSDRDGDGLPDRDDQCPDTPGPIENQGCPWPDRDGDTVFDKDDDCPDTPGPVENKGCPWPDRDGDTVLDKDDECPDIPGPVENKGCPLDSDGDGLYDFEDECPHEPGPKENKGCPVKIERVKVTSTSIEVTEQIFFEFAKSIIQERSFGILNTVADAMKNHPAITRIRIEGHTDDVGSDADNLTLSKARAKSVREYLVAQGIAESRLDSEGYGERVPLCPNIEALLKDKEGNKESIDLCRASNRRVEFRIIEIDNKPIKASKGAELKKVETIEVKNASLEEQAAYKKAQEEKAAQEAASQHASEKKGGEKSKKKK